MVAGFEADEKMDYTQPQSCIRIRKISVWQGRCSNLSNRFISAPESPNQAAKTFIHLLTDRLAVDLQLLGKGKEILAICKSLICGNRDEFRECL